MERCEFLMTLAAAPMETAVRLRLAAAEGANPMRDNACKVEMARGAGEASILAFA